VLSFFPPALFAGKARVYRKVGEGGSAMCSLVSSYWSVKSGLFSAGYRAGRALTIASVYAMQGLQKRARDLEDVVDIGDLMLKSLPRPIFNFPIPEGIEARLYDLPFPSPLTIASFKDSLDVMDRWMALGFGGATIKTVMREKRGGNPRPRLREIPGGGFLNAMGLPCPGIERVLAELKEHAGGVFRHRRPLGISIGGSSYEEYMENFEALNGFFAGSGHPHYYEINISCPNTPEGQMMSRHHEILSDLLAFMRERTEAVIAVKLSQDMMDEEILAFAAHAGAFRHVALNLGNTSYRACHQVGLPDGALSVGGGGMSGPSIYPRTLAMTKIVSPTGIGIIATGGIDSAAKVRELLSSGASIVGMASALVRDMFCVPRINRELAR
jgi:dihydroorotate dehydrogenase (NAD+) catalytic subunit